MQYVSSILFLLSLLEAAAAASPIQLADGYYYIQHISRASSPENDWKHLSYYNDRSVRLRDNSSPLWLVTYPDKTGAPNEFELQLITTGRYKDWGLKRTRFNWLELGPVTTDVLPKRFIAYFAEPYGEAKGRFYIRSARDSKKWLGHTKKKVRLSRWRSKRVWQFVPSESVSHPTKLSTKYKEGLLHLPQAFDRFATSRNVLPGGYERPEESSSESQDLSPIFIDRDASAQSQAQDSSSSQAQASNTSSSENSIVQDLSVPVDEEEEEERPCFKLFSWPPAWWIRFIQWFRG